MTTKLFCIWQYILIKSINQKFGYIIVYYTKLSYKNLTLRGVSRTRSSSRLKQYLRKIS
jgi:hypothetical protein